MELLTGIGIFILFVMIIEGIYFVFRGSRNSEKKAVRKRLKTLSWAGIEEENRNIVRKKSFSQIPWLNQLLQKFRWTERTNLLLEQAAVERSLGFYILLSFFLAAAGFYGASRVTANGTVFILVAAVLGTTPFFYLSFLKRQRMRKFQEQFPEALDLIARALRAGHAFTGGLKLVGDEMSDPIGTEFEKTLNEINFGVGVPEALRNLATRVACPDLKFFVISVVIQRESGGNLAEILEKIAYLIRERFRLFGRIRILAAQGKISAAILVIIPFVVALGISILNPKYIRILSTDPLGRLMVVFALILMVVGVFVMRKIIAIKV